MTRGYCLLLLLLLALAGATWGDSSVSRTTKQLLAKLRTDYDPAIRPAQSDNETTMVKVQTRFRDLEFDDVNMEANFDITFRMIWNDYRLAYSPPEGVEFVTVLDADLVWLPDAFFKNAQVTQRSTIHPETFMRIYPDGRVVYSTRLSLQQSCPMNLARFPHDSQTCVVKIASYGYTTDKIKFTFDDGGVTIAHDIHEARFNLIGFLSSYCDSTTSTGSYSCLKVSMDIRRVSGSYVIDWYFPTIFLVVVAWFSFLVPSDMFLGRLLLTLVPLMTLASIANRIKESLASVPYVRALDIFMGVSLCIIFVTLVYVIVCQVHGSKKAAGDDEKTGNVEDGEVKPSHSGGETTGVRGLMQRIQKWGQFFSCAAIITIITVYIIFLVVYFVSYCGSACLH